jgi:hypothetical protein
MESKNSVDLQPSVIADPANTTALQQLQSTETTGNAVVHHLLHTLSTFTICCTEHKIRFSPCPLQTGATNEQLAPALAVTTSTHIVRLCLTLFKHECVV